MSFSKQIGAPPKTLLRSGRRILLVSGGIFVFIVIAVFLSIGRWLVIEDPLEKAQAIAVLSGRMPTRAIEAAKLYREGYAPEVWLTRTVQPGESLKQLGIPYVGEDFYNFRVLVEEGVPSEAIRVLATPIVNTADEMNVIAKELEAKKGGSVIIVTTKAHTRRVRTLWHRFATGQSRAAVRAVSDDSFDPRHWWRTSSDALDVVREVLGLLNAWAGLPLHGSS